MDESTVSRRLSEHRRFSEDLWVVVGHSFGETEEETNDGGAAFSVAASCENAAFGSSFLLKSQTCAAPTLRRNTNIYVCVL